MKYIEEKKGPMCSVGKNTENNKYMLKMLVGGTKETFIEISKTEYDLFPQWTRPVYENIKERLLKIS